MDGDFIKSASEGPVPRGGSEGLGVDENIRIDAELDRVWRPGCPKYCAFNENTRRPIIPGEACDDCVAFCCSVLPHPGCHRLDLDTFKASYV